MSKQDAQRIAAAEEGSVYSSISYRTQGWKLTRCSNLRHIISEWAVSKGTAMDSPKWIGWSIRR
jgi:hypothetical protein